LGYRREGRRRDEGQRVTFTFARDEIYLSNLYDFAIQFPSDAHKEHWRFIYNLPQLYKSSSAFLAPSHWHTFVSATQLLCRLGNLYQSWLTFSPPARLKIRLARTKRTEYFRSWN
jgi:hypothetical protein